MAIVAWPMEVEIVFALAPAATAFAAVVHYRLTSNPAGPPPKFHDDPDILAAKRRPIGCSWSSCIGLGSDERAIDLWLR